MDVLISDNWLREYLSTKATPKDIEKYVSLCGPSIEKVEAIEGDSVYHVEITTNRIDSVGVYGFARECAAILPRFGFKTALKPLKSKKSKKGVSNFPFTIINKERVVYRAMGIVMTNIKNNKSPKWMIERLKASGIRSLNAIVDITNYVMLELGQPMHAFDYDKIKNRKFVIRTSIANEKVTSFDGKTYTLAGGDIVFDDGEGCIIDLPGIIGTKNSVVDDNTQNVFLFIDNNDPARIRKTSMTHAIRTVAASINEKGVDPELADLGLRRGIELFQDVCKAVPASKIFDHYPVKFKPSSIQVTKEFIDSRLGVELKKNNISNYLESLEFKSNWKGSNLIVTIPSFRNKDIQIPEDIVEEIARIYGYHNLPSKLMDGKIPDHTFSSTFGLEKKIKNILKALGGNEVYTLSLVADTHVNPKKSLSLLNPLGKDTTYLRTSLKKSLIEAVDVNKGNYEQIFLFEISNVYIPQDGRLPDEQMTLGILLDGYKFPNLKGILDVLLTKELHINYDLDMKSNFKIFKITSNGESIGKIDLLDDGKSYIELKLYSLSLIFREYGIFNPIPKHPPQIEDLTFKSNNRLYKDIVEKIKKVDSKIFKVDYVGKYHENITIRIYYLDPEKTLDDEEIEKIRNKVEKIIYI